MESERYFSGEIAVALADGSRLPAKVTADEIYETGKEIYRISFEQGPDARKWKRRVLLLSVCD